MGNRRQPTPPDPRQTKPAPPPAPPAPRQIERRRVVRPVLRQTHTYAVLEISRAAYDEIHQKLDAAGYQHTFDGDVIDMHGIAVQAYAEGDKP